MGMDVCLKFKKGREKRSFTRDLFLSFCMGNLEQVFMKFGKQRDQFRISTKSKMDNPLATPENFNREFQPGKKGREAVQWG
jgi:hypothetical protein